MGAGAVLNAAPRAQSLEALKAARPRPLTAEKWPIMLKRGQFAVKGFGLHR